jgi:[protein-PII] uridylyltransferase
MIAGNLHSNKTPEAAAALLARTGQVDRMVAAAWNEHMAPSAPEGTALLAVGGFGRRELFAYSDVDLLVLFAKPDAADLHRAQIAAFLQNLWDCGLRVSHSVHTPAECSEVHERNIELNVSLLDARYLAGDRGLYERLADALKKFYHAQRPVLARHLCRMARERHSQTGGSIYQLEPNVKEGPGGLRDYQTICWLGKLRGVDPPPELSAARDFLFEVRHFIHQRAGRDSNALTFDFQEEIADQTHTDPGAWMRGYFGCAREIWRTAVREIEAVEEQASSLLVQFREWRSRVSNAEFSVSRERVFLRAPARLAYEPPLAFRLFEFVARHGVRLAPETERRVAESLEIVGSWLESARGAVWPIFRAILAGRHATMALRGMHETGLLEVLFPEWSGIDCLVVRDFYHRYTVDEHTLVAIRTLEELPAAPEGPKRFFADLLAETPAPELLSFALLFHDVGKAARSGSHVRFSVDLAERAMERIGMPVEDRRLVLRLIESHLELSKLMMSRDLADPATARLLADRAGTVEFLKQLTLLTYADISAVNPTAMSPWRMDQLCREYLVTYNELTLELEDARVDSPATAPDFLAGFPVRYLRTHTEAEIQEHIALDRLSRERGFALDIRKDNGYYRMTLVARDRPFLLASLAGALAGFGMNILKAEGFANRQGTILDTFVFADPHRSLELNPTEMDRLKVTIERAALGKLNLKPLLASRPKPRLPSSRARFHPAVSFNDVASEFATLIQVVAQDRPGLLYDLTSAISSAGANIELVLIDTQAHKAIDVFYVTSEGAKLSPARQTEVAAALQGACG